MSQHDRYIGEVYGNVVDIHRVAVFQSDAAAAAHARTDSAVPRVENNRQPRLGDGFI